VNGSLVSPATRQRVRDLATPIAVALGRLGLTPNALTIIGFLGTSVAAAAAASQAWWVAGILVLVFGILDLFDGTLARATGRTSTFGAFLDSTLDRAGEAITYVGVAAGCLAAGFELGAVVAAAALGASSLVSYVRAKAESLAVAPPSGMASVGLAPREVRLALLAVGLLVAGVLGPVGPWTFVCPANQLVSCASPDAFQRGDLILGCALGLIAILATVTVVQRILQVRTQTREG
jgi:CDP-diacylglycerol--glycerol-3-phosphate 3-phosphatidyltransferase